MLINFSSTDTPVCTCDARNTQYPLTQFPTAFGNFPCELISERILRLCVRRFPVFFSALAHPVRLLVALFLFVTNAFFQRPHREVRLLFVNHQGRAESQGCVARSQQEKPLVKRRLH
jgi:hypothetical protein